MNADALLSRNAEILKLLDSQPRYAFKTTKGSRKWHKLYKEFEGETPLLMKARCGFKCGGNVAVEVYRTLGTGDRCSKWNMDQTTASELGALRLLAPSS